MSANLAQVAVIGAGPAGLAAMKNLLDEGFNVTGFEQRSEPGGIWAFTEDPNITSTTKNTRAQLSRYMTPFTDFPHQDDAPLHPTAQYLAAYYRDYARHFGIYDKIAYNAAVKSVTRDEASSKWLVWLGDDEQPRAFDKVVFATGTEHKPKYPKIEGLDKFGGTLIHGQAYKKADDFKGKNVVVIGQGNSAGDCAVDLALGGAGNVYLAHRRGAIILPRVSKGERFDKRANWRLTRFGFWLSAWFPFLHRLLFHKAFQYVAKAAWGDLDPQWRFDINPSYTSNLSGIMVNDDIVRLLREGAIQSVNGVRRVCGPRCVEIDDGTRIEDVDAIIACTGYTVSFDICGSAVSYSEFGPDISPLPNLYRNIFPVEHADSVAFVSYIVLMESAFLTRELAGMAIAQIWAGKSTLPSRKDMVRSVQEQHAWYNKRCATEPLSQYEGMVEPHDWSRFINGAAGTGMYENLGWTVRGFWFMLREPVLSLRMNWGTHSPHMYRFFETGKRKAWHGAREAITVANDVALGHHSKVKMKSA